MKFDSFSDALAAATEAIQNKELNTAAEIFRGLPDAFPAKKHAVIWAADGLKQCGHWSEAVGLLLKAVEQWPYSPLYLTHLSATYAGIGDAAKAAEYLRRSLERPESLDPNIGVAPQVWKQLGNLYAQAGNYERAAGAFGRMLSIDPLDVEASVRRGDALLALQRLDDAMADYNRALAVQPNNAEALRRLGEVTLEYRTPRDALPYLERAVAADPMNVIGYANLSLGLSSVGLFQDAARIAEHGFRIDRTVIGARAWGIALTGLGEFDQAVEILRAAVDAEPGNTGVSMALADAEMGRGDVYGAERALQQVLAADPNNPTARFRIGALHGEAIETAPVDAAADRFNLLAARYDHDVVPRLGYTAPAMSVALVEEALPEQSAFGRVLDLGCGTGLVVASLRDAFRVDEALGVDAARRMIQIAGSKGLYDHLIIGDAIPTIADLDERFDLITAIELAPHLGDLSSLFAAVRARLVDDGLFLCSIELSDGASLALKSTARFTHDPVSVEHLGKASGFQVLATRAFALHRHGADETTGAILLFRRVAGEA